MNPFQNANDSQFWRACRTRKTCWIWHESHHSLLHASSSSVDFAPVEASHFALVDSIPSSPIETAVSTHIVSTAPQRKKIVLATARVLAIRGSSLVRGDLCSC